MTFFPQHRPVRKADDPLGDISQKLSDAIKQSKGPTSGTKDAQEPAPDQDTEGGTKSPNTPESKTAPETSEAIPAPEASGSGVPDLQAPALPTEPSMTLPSPSDLGGTPAPTETLPQVSEHLEKLEQSISKLVDGLTETITTSAPAGQATLNNAPKKEGLDGENLDFGLEPTSSHPFSRPVAHTRRSPMLNKQKVASPAKRRAEDGITATPPEGLEGLYEEPTPKVDGEESFVVSPPKVVSEKELDNAVAQSQQDSELAQMLSPKASELRAARKARLGLDYDSFMRVSQEGKSALFAAAERKASDLAALRVTRYHRAAELAHQAQERGIVEFPLQSLLAARLATYGVPDAELVAADVLEGASMESFKAAHQAALKYMAMDDASFLNVQETIAATPKSNARGAYSSDHERTARKIRKEASDGSLPIQASTPDPQSGAESLRQILRAGTPRPHTLSR